MEKEKFSEYLQDRYGTQINWYDTKAAKNKKLYMFFQWGVIILSATLPVLVMSLTESARWITASIAAILAIGTAVLKTFKFQENWLGYRTIAESLKKEKYFYDAGLEDYADASDKEARFVERVESLISRENSLWINSHLQKEDEQEEKKGKQSNTRRY